MFELHYAEAPAEGGEASDSVLSAWLFDDTHRERDAVVIAEDFCDEARKKLGIARKNPVTAGKIDLPEKSERRAGDALSMQGFAQRFLACYPQYKDAYRDNIADYGDFMYFDFFKRYGVEKLREVASSGSSKQIDKMLDLLNEFYCQGDKEVGDVIAACIFAGAFYNDTEGFAEFCEKGNYFENYPFLKTAAAEAIKLASKNKKLQEALEV